MASEQDNAVDKVLAALRTAAPPEDMEARILQRMQHHAATQAAPLACGETSSAAQPSLARGGVAHSPWSRGRDTRRLRNADVPASLGGHHIRRSRRQV